MSTLEQRLLRIERENRSMRRLGAVVLALGVAVVLTGQGRNDGPSLVRAREIRVVDGAGHTRILLAADSAEARGTSLVLYDEDGAPCASMKVDLDRSEVWTIAPGGDAAKGARVTITAAAPDPTLGGYASIDLRSLGHRGIGVVAGDPLGPEISLREPTLTELVKGSGIPETRTLASLAVHEGAPSLTLLDADGRIAFRAPK